MNGRGVVVRGRFVACWGAAGSPSSGLFPDPLGGLLGVSPTLPGVLPGALSGPRRPCRVHLGAYWGSLGGLGPPRSSLWALLGGIWGSVGAVLGSLEALLGRLGAFLGRLGALLALGPSWDVLKLSWAVLGPSWAILEPSWAVLEAILAVLEASWAVWRPSWASWVLERFFDDSGPS